MDSIDICVFNTCDRQPPPQSRTCKKEEEREPEKEEEEMELEKEEEREPEKIFRQFCAIAFGFTSPVAAPPVINVAFFTGLAVCLWSLLQRVHTAQRIVQVCRILKFKI